MKDYIYRIRELRPVLAGLIFTACVFSLSLPRNVLSSDWVYESANFYAVWGSSANDIFAVGRYGAILHYDGVAWLPMASGADACASGMKLQDVWGSSSTDVFAVGCYDQRGGPFCTGDDNVVVHYDGNRWTPMATGVDGSLNGVWGSAADDIFAVGNGGLILHHDGTGWSTMAFDTPADLYDLWGTSATDIYAVGSGGTILHYDGSGWESMTSGTTAHLKAVWTASPTGVYAVGDGGVILRYDGSSWSSMASSTTSHLDAIWGSSASNIYAVGSDGTVLRFNGSNWSLLDPGTSAYLSGVWGSSSTNIFLVGANSTIKRYSGSSWTTHYAGTAEKLSDIWGTSQNNVYAVGHAGTILHRDTRGWKTMESGTSENLFGVWGSAANNIYAAGEAGTILRYTGSSWSRIHSDPEVRLSDIWGSSATDVYIAGFRRKTDLPYNDGYLMHFDGSTWTGQVFAEFLRFYGIWGTAADEIFMVGSDIDEEERPILYFDGSSWAQMDAAIVETLAGIWGSSSDRAYTVGTGGGLFDLYPVIYKYNGSYWTQDQLAFPPGVNAGLSAVSGRPATDTYAVGRIDEGGYEGQVIVKSRGAGWYVDRLRPNESSLSGLWTSNTGHLFAVGASGAIMRLPPPAASSADPQEPWAATYVGSAADIPAAVEATRDGGSIVVGETSSFGDGDRDIWVIKLLADGTVQWQLAYDGGGADTPSSIKTTADSGYIISGTTDSFGADGDDAFLLKLDALGSIQWQKAYGGAGDESGTAVLEVAGCEAGYVLLGKTSTGPDEADNWLMKVDPDGVIEWQKSYPIGGMESLDTLVPAKGYGYYAAGKTDPFDSGYGDFLVLRLDDDGDIIWQRSFGLYSFVPPNQYNMNTEKSARIWATMDGGAVLTGSSSAIGVDTFAWFLKLDADGVSEWQKIYAPLEDCSVKFVQQTADRGYLVGGNIYGKTGYGWLMKLTASGGLEWTRVYASAGEPRRTFMYAARQMADGGYTAIGTSYFLTYNEADFLVLRLDDTGSIPDCAVVSGWASSAEDVSVPGATYTAAVTSGSLAASPMNLSAVITEVEPADNCLSLSTDIIDLPQTGQQNCFDAAGNSIPCSTSGQDGDLRAGVVWPPSRFADQGDGTVVDTLTGLNWLKDGNCALTIGHDPDGRGTGAMDWLSGLDFVAGINAGTFDISACTGSAGTYNDWRLANIVEMESLFHAGLANPADWLNAQGFGNVPFDPSSTWGSSFWSATPYASISSYGSYVWIVDLNRGRIEYRRKSSFCYVWPVRGGVWFHPDPVYPANVWKTGMDWSLSAGDDGNIQAGVTWPEPRFTDNGDGTVTDNLTGLMWLKHPACLGSRKWLDALATVSDFNQNPVGFECEDYSADYTDWRLANRKEYLSLIDYSEPAYGGHPSLVEGHPFIDVTGDAYWSSTTDESRSRENSAFTFFVSGSLTTQAKATYYNRVWPVRGWPSCRGDLDGDGDVDGMDIHIFLADWQRNDCCDSGADDCEADLDDSCTVDEMDLRGVTIEFGRLNCPVSP